MTAYFMDECRMVLRPASLTLPETLFEKTTGWCVLPCLPDELWETRVNVVGKVVGELILEW